MKLYIPIKHNKLVLFCELGAAPYNGKIKVLTKTARRWFCFNLVLLILRGGISVIFRIARYVLAAIPCFFFFIQVIE
jgi:hypothetical protein